VKRPPTPKTLGSAGRTWFRRTCQEFEFTTAAELQLLTQAAACLDRLQECRASIKEHGLLVKAGSGGWKPNPSVSAEIQYRTLFARLCRELRLCEPPQEEVRPPRISTHPPIRKGA